MWFDRRSAACSGYHEDHRRRHRIRHYDIPHIDARASNISSKSFSHFYCTTYNCVLQFLEPTFLIFPSHPFSAFSPCLLVASRTERINRKAVWNAGWKGDSVIKPPCDHLRPRQLSVSRVLLDQRGSQAVMSPMGAEALKFPRHSSHSWEFYVG